MRRHEVVLPVAGPWSLETGKRFWESFAPAAIPAHDAEGVLHARFLGESDWVPSEATVVQEGDRARITVAGEGDLDAAAEQVTRFLSLDVDAAAWPAVGERDPIIAAAQRALPGFRPCGFHSPYEAASWAVLSQRTRVRDAAMMRRQIIAEHGSRGAFPAPAALLRALADGALELPGRKNEYLGAVATAAADGVLTGPHLRSLPEDLARDELRGIIGIGPFATDLILIRGANAADILPRAERRLDQEVASLYGADADLAAVAENWRPFRSWAAVHLRAGREGRMHEMG